MQIGILEAREFSKNAFAKLSKIGRVELFDSQCLAEFLENKEILFIRLDYFIDDGFLEKSKKLKYICTPTTGLNHIDLKTCKEKNIEIISLKGEYDFLSTIRATPEHTFGLVIALLRNYKEAFLNENNVAWNREKYRGYELYKNKVGIIGLGRVGKILTKYLRAFDVDVYFYDINNLIEDTYAQKTFSITELIETSKIIILSASYTADNHAFFDSKYIDLLHNKFFINTARGELLDESYLLDKLQEDYFKGVALDVIQNEQAQNSLQELLTLTQTRNLIITPHIAGATYSSMHRTEEFIANKLINKLGGKKYEYNLCNNGINV